MNRLQVELDIEGIERMCDHATSGNVAHVIGTIKSYCRMMKEELDVPDWSHYRIQAAIAAMQGFIQSKNTEFYSLEDVKKWQKVIIRNSIVMADALIEELKKK